jgi:hypothetical protein
MNIRVSISQLKKMSRGRKGAIENYPYYTCPSSIFASALLIALRQVPTLSNYLLLFVCPNLFPLTCPSFLPLAPIFNLLLFHTQCLTCFHHLVAKVFNSILVHVEKKKKKLSKFENDTCMMLNLLSCIHHPQTN